MSVDQWAECTRCALIILQGVTLDCAPISMTAEQRYSSMASVSFSALRKFHPAI